MDVCLVPPRQYNPPQTLPAGWWDALQNLADWVRHALVDAYDAGYMAGKLDTLRARHDAVDESSDEIDSFLRGFRKPS